MSQTFCVVYVIDPIVGEFVIGGIFSKPEDAQAFADGIKARGETCTNPSRETMSQIKDQLVHDRLHVLADALKQLLPEAFGK